MDKRLDQIARRLAGDPSGKVGSVRTAGKIEFVKDTGPVRRDLRVEGFEWTPETLRNLAKILWTSQRAHSYAMAGLRMLSKLPSSQFSPDGLLGGKGYIQSVKDIRTSLGQSVESLSSITDTLFDEINGEHWRSVDDAEAEALVNSSEEVKSNPEGFVEQSFDDDNEGEDWDDNIVVNPTPDAMNPEVAEDESEEEDGEEDDESDWESGLSQTASAPPEKDEDTDSLPTDDSDQEFSMSAPEIVQRTVLPKSGNFAAAFAVAVRRFAGGSSSLPVDATPGGPRVDHIGPAEGGEFGWFNGPDATPSDDPAMQGFFSENPVYESGNEDGVTGYDNPTEGDPTVLNLGSSGYSWLPGSSNEKTMNYYTPGLTEEDVEWMKSNSAPDNPLDPPAPVRDNSSAWLWEDGRV